MEVLRGRVIYFLSGQALSVWIRIPEKKSVFGSFICHTLMRQKIFTNNASHLFVCFFLFFNTSYFCT
jgi:hypothetical protein